MPRGLSFVCDAAPDVVPVVCVGHVVPGDFGMVVPQDVPDALAVLVDVLVLAVFAVFVVLIVLAVLVDVHVLAVLGVVDLLVDVPVLAVLVDVLVLAVLGVVDVPVAVLVLAVLGVVDVVVDILVLVSGAPGLAGTLSPVKTFTSSLAVRSRRTRQRRSWW